MSYFSVNFITELNINLKSWPISSLWHKLLQHLERWKGKAKYYPKLRTRISHQFSKAELSWKLKRGEFSEFRGLDEAWQLGTASLKRLLAKRPNQKYVLPRSIETKTKNLSVKTVFSMNMLKIIWQTKGCSKICEWWTLDRPGCTCCFLLIFSAIFVLFTYMRVFQIYIKGVPKKKIHKEFES